MKAAPVVRWETKRAFDHLGAHHFLMPLLKHDYGETFPLTLYVASSARVAAREAGSVMLYGEKMLFAPRRDLRAPWHFHVSLFLLGHRQAQPQFDQALPIIT